MIPLLLIGAALAGGVHVGIPVTGVPGLGEPSFLTPATGWTAAVEGGWVRVYVGPTEAAGVEWYARMLESLGVQPAVLPDLGAHPGVAAHLGPVDAAHGDGETLVAFRDGNVGVLVRAQGGARAIADVLLAAIVDDGPAVRTPTISSTAGPERRWEVDAPGSVHLSFTGGRAVPFQRGVYTQAPREIVSWDAWGRASVLTP
ncbi:MAG: hypothetical protein Q8P41_09750 [Pseudomonadota bacterium]|nr:hypothetical protein [Pseudomonadota bacterium]